MNAVFDLKLALGAWETRYRTSNEWKNRWLAATAPIGAALLGQGNRFTALTGGISSAMEWRSQAHTAEQAMIDGPATRITAALARLAVSAPLDRALAQFGGAARSLAWRRPGLRRPASRKQ